MFLEEITLTVSDCSEARSASNHKHTRISMFSLSLSRRQWAGCTAAQAKPSRHDKTIVVQPCSHPMPSPDLEKVRKNGIFVVFLRKEKTKKLRSYFAKSLLIPQPQLQANAVLSKTAKVPSPRVECARERRKLKSKTARPCCCCAQPDL